MATKTNKNGVNVMKKMVLSAGLALLSVCTLVQGVSAAPIIEGQFKRTNESGYVTYQLKVTEPAEDVEANIEIKDFFKKTGDATEPLSDGEILLKKLNASKTEALVVIRVADTVNKLIVSNNKVPTEQTEIEVVGDNAVEITVDNDGPDYDPSTLIRYQGDGGKYIQAKFVDNTKIHKVKDANGHERVLLKEKGTDKEVVLKYLLEDGADSFVIYDILGNPKTITFDEAKIETAFNARNLEGTTVAIDVTREFTVTEGEEPSQTTTTYQLAGIKTGAGENVTLKALNDNIYESVQAGTTKFVLTYVNTEYETDTKTVVIPLMLDVTGPIGVKYSATALFDTVNDEEDAQALGHTIAEDFQAGTIRAYRNNTTKRGIIEVRDIQSGIQKIQLLTGTEGNYTIEDVTTENKITINGEEYKTIDSIHDNEDKGVVYYNRKLQSTLLWQFPITEDTTAVRVTDGIGVTADIPLSAEDTGVTLAAIKKYGDNYVVVAQDTKAGLWRIDREADNEAGYITIVDLDGVNITKDGTKDIYTLLTGTELEESLTHIGYDEAEHTYRQYTLDRLTKLIDPQGKPVIHVYDALGNVQTVTFDDIAFTVNYATYGEDGILSLNIVDVRGIYKVEYTMVDMTDAELALNPEPVLTVQKPTEGDDLTKWNEWDNEDPALTEIPAADVGNYDELWNTYLTYKSEVAAKQAWSDEHRKTYTVEIFKADALNEENEPRKLIKTYEIPEGGKVENVKIYNTRGEEELSNLINSVLNVVDVPNTDRIKTLNSDTNTDLAYDNQDNFVGTTVRARYGIKTVEYEDGTVINYRDDLPTILFVNCATQDGFKNCVVTDAIGYSLEITNATITASYDTIHPILVAQN